MTKRKTVKEQNVGNDHFENDLLNEARLLSRQRMLGHRLMEIEFEKQMVVEELENVSHRLDVIMRSR